MYLGGGYKTNIRIVTRVQWIEGILLTKYVEWIAASTTTALLLETLWKSVNISFFLKLFNTMSIAVKNKLYCRVVKKLLKLTHTHYYAHCLL